MLGRGGEAGGRRATAVPEDGRVWGVVVGLAAVEEAVVALVCTTLYHDTYMQHAPSFSHLQLFHNIIIVNTDPVRTSTTPVRCDDVADGEVLA